MITIDISIKEKNNHWGQNFKNLKNFKTIKKAK